MQCHSDVCLVDIPQIGDHAFHISADASAYQRSIKVTYAIPVITDEVEWRSYKLWSAVSFNLKHKPCTKRTRRILNSKAKLGQERIRRTERDIEPLIGVKIFPRSSVRYQ